MSSNPGTTPLVLQPTFFDSTDVPKKDGNVRFFLNDYISHHVVNDETLLESPTENTTKTINSGYGYEHECSHVGTLAAWLLVPKTPTGNSTKGTFTNDGTGTPEDSNPRKSTGENITCESPDFQTGVIRIRQPSKEEAAEMTITPIRFQNVYCNPSSNINDFSTDLLRDQGIPVSDKDPTWLSFESEGVRVQLEFDQRFAHNRDMYLNFGKPPLKKDEIGVVDGMSH